MSARRIFISTATNEFKSCRERVSDDLRSPSVVVENQEEYIAKTASGHSMLIKLDDYIKDCHAVIHLIGQQTSTDGRAAHQEAVDDILKRYPDLPAVMGLSEVKLRMLSYTQWEAWLAYYHIKSTRLDLKLVIATPTAGFSPDNPPDPATARKQKCSQAWHEKQLRQRARYSEISFADCKELSIAILKALKDILPAAPPKQSIAPSRIVSRHTASDATKLEFLGREPELALLDTAWTTPATNLLSIIAWGGVGKTALIAEWIERRFVQREWKNAEGQCDPVCYFDWTFYDQGTRADDASHAGAASVGSFFETALRFLGDPDPNLPGKGARLAALIQAQRSLLVLDGLEPLQYPPSHPQAGQLTDPDLHTLLATLAQRNPGLCVLTSRQPLTGLAGVKEHPLDELPEAVAIRLLQKIGVIGTDADLAEAVRDYFGHALSLIVLGRFLFVKGGDIRIRKQIPLEKANDNRQQTITRNAWHVLEAYEAWLASPDGRPGDLQALRLMGLFDRPASPECLAVLRREPAIPGLTEHLVPLDDDAWNAVLHRLDEAHLIQLRYPPRAEHSLALRPEARQVPADAHPLIREYFAKQLRDKHDAGHQAAHSRLFDYLCQSTEHQPATLDGLQPLYQAVVHGCWAGRQQEACVQVYRDRILRGTGPGGFYSRNKLGAIGANLGAVAAFFEAPWTRLSPNLSEPAQAWLLNEAAFYLRALGRLTEAVEPMRVSGEMDVTAKNWQGAAISYSNLSELEVTLGRVGEAVADARRAIDFADRSGKWEERMINRTTAADALHQSGEWDEARRLFEQAETLQRERQPEFDRLYSLQGFRFCDLILAPAERAAWGSVIGQRRASPSGGTGKAEPGDALPAKGPQPPAAPALAEAERRAKQALNIAEKHGLSLLTIALDHLTLARVALYRALLDPVRHSPFDIPHFIPALDGLRNAGMLDYLPQALLTAALYHHRLGGDAAAARRDLDEAQQIAERGPMPLYLADVHLHRARLFHDRAELAKARDLIATHGYGRRKEELADAEAAAVDW
jgi:tetratricopeptide (TPR) repeat protein